MPIKTSTKFTECQQQQPVLVFGTIESSLFWQNSSSKPEPNSNCFDCEGSPYKFPCFTLFAFAFNKKTIEAQALMHHLSFLFTK
jgi:hypothetical protein